MSTPKVSFAPPRQSAGSTGVRDGGHVLLKCSNCDKPLCDIHITQPDKLIPGTQEKFEWYVRAKCCYGCKRGKEPEYSYIEKIVGLYHLGGYGVVNPEDPDDSTVITVPVGIIDELDSDGNAVITFEVMEAK